MKTKVLNIIQIVGACAGIISAIYGQLTILIISLSIVLISTLIEKWNDRI